MPWKCESLDYYVINACHNVTPPYFGDKHTIFYTLKDLFDSDDLVNSDPADSDYSYKMRVYRYNLVFLWSSDLAV